MDRLGLPATARISIGMYNTTADIDAAVAAIRKVKELFRC
jgi:cysteine desulfurase/selenocysteine lyase